MNVIQVTQPYGRQCNRILDSSVTIMKNKKIKIDHAIYIKILYDENVSYLAFSTDYVINITNNEK